MTWKQCWREGFAPLLSIDGLRALRGAMERNDAELLQRDTTNPLPLMAYAGQKCTGACAVGYAAWRGDGLSTVREVAEWFGQVCYLADYELGGPGKSAAFLNWFDDTPRHEVFAAMLPEIERELRQRVINDTKPAPAA